VKRVGCYSVVPVGSWRLHWCDVSPGHDVRWASLTVKSFTDDLGVQPSSSGHRCARVFICGYYYWKASEFSTHSTNYYRSQPPGCPSGQIFGGAMRAPSVRYSFNFNACCMIGRSMILFSFCERWRGWRRVALHLCTSQRVCVFVQPRSIGQGLCRH